MEYLKHFAKYVTIPCKGNLLSPFFLTLQVNNKWIKYILAKGFIAVEGISLTVSRLVAKLLQLSICLHAMREQRLLSQVGEVGRDWFCVYLIPETLRATTLGSKSEGGVVNIEIDAQTQVTDRIITEINSVLFECKICLHFRVDLNVRYAADPYIPDTFYIAGYC